jgi:hypothetical protein
MRSKKLIKTTSSEFVPEISISDQQMTLNLTWFLSLTRAQYVSGIVSLCNRCHLTVYVALNSLG